MSNARKRAIERGVEIFSSDLHKSGGHYSFEEVRRILDLPQEEIVELVKRHEIFTVETPHGSVFPKVQFDEHKRPIPRLRLVIEALTFTGGAAVLNFLVNPDPRLDGRMPLDALMEGDLAAVIVAARSYGTQGA